MKTINTMQKLKNIIRSNNNIIAKKTSRNYLKSNNKSINISYIYKSKRFKSINKQFKEHLYTLNNSYK